VANGSRGKRQRQSVAYWKEEEDEDESWREIVDALVICPLVTAAMTAAAAAATNTTALLHYVESSSRESLAI